MRPICTATAVALSIFASACASPVIGEETPSLESCRNGYDDDVDGNTDCEDQRCVDGGFCNQFETNCTTVPQSGCPIGMGCYVTFNTATSTTSFRCQIAGAGITSIPCSLSAVYGATTPHQCQVGHVCSGMPEPPTCTRYCEVDSDCDPGGHCVSGPDGADTCTIPCSPSSAAGTCGPGTVCTSLHRFGYGYDFGGAYFACYVPTRTRGTATVGQACADPPVAATPDAQICLPNLACVPDATGARTCTTVCTVGSSECAVSLKSCVPFYPGEWPSAYGTSILGYCL